MKAQAPSGGADSHRGVSGMDRHIDPELLVLEPVVRAVAASIDAAIERRDGAGLPALRRRAGEILTQPTSRSARTGLEERIKFELEWWLYALREAFPSDIVERLGAELLALDVVHGFVSPWSPLVASSSHGRYLDTRSRLLDAGRDALGMCRQYERSRRTSHLRDAVATLEAHVRREAIALGTSGIPPEELDEQTERLGEALAHVLPASVIRFFVPIVRSKVEHDLVTSGPSKSGDQLLSSEDWIDVRTGTEVEDRVWFCIEAFQHRYEEGVRRDREDRERRRRAAEDLPAPSHTADPPRDTPQSPPAMPTPSTAERRAVAGDETSPPAWPPASPRRRQKDPFAVAWATPEEYAAIESAPPVTDTGDADDEYMAAAAKQRQMDAELRRAEIEAGERARTAEANSRRKAIIPRDKDDWR